MLFFTISEKIGFGKNYFSIENDENWKESKVNIDINILNANGIIKMENDFLKIKHIEWKNKTIFEIMDRQNKTLYKMNYSMWKVGNSSLYSYNKSIYFYDWQSHKWKIWEKNELSDFKKPYFRHVFKWMVEAEKNVLSTDIFSLI